MMTMRMTAGVKLPLNFSAILGQIYLIAFAKGSEIDGNDNY